MNIFFTEEMFLEAVKQNGMMLKYVGEIKQTEEICLEAVKQNGLAINFVNEQTTEICMAAVKQNGWAIQYIKEKTPEICMEAVLPNVVHYCKSRLKTKWKCYYICKRKNARNLFGGSTS